MTIGVFPAGTPTLTICAPKSQLRQPAADGIGLAHRLDLRRAKGRLVMIAKAEDCGCPPGVVRGSACYVAIASSVNQTVRRPHCRNAASDSGQFVTRYRGFGRR